MELFKILGRIAVDNDEAINSINATSDSASSAENKLVSAFKKIGSAVVAAFAVDKIISFGQEIAKLSAEVSAEQSAFEQIMGDYSSAATEKLNAVADATGAVSTRMTPYFTSLTAKFKGLGYDVDDATSLASDGLSLAADAAAFWDKSLDDSMGALNSFINGSYEGGEAIGLFANDTQMAAFAVKQGIVKNTKAWSELDEATKQATRLEYAQAMFKLSGATGQAAKESDQYANVQANLVEKWRQFKAEIGEPVLQKIVLPAMKKLSELVDFGSEKFQAFQEKWPEFQQKAQDVGDYLSETFSPVISDVSDLFTAVKDAVQPVIDKFTDYFTSGEATEDISTRIKDVLERLVTSYQTIKTNVETFIETVTNYVSESEEVEAVTNAVKDAVGFLSEKWTEVKTAAEPFIEKLGELKEKFDEYVSSGELGEDVANGIATAFEAVYDAGVKVVEKITAFSDWCAEHQTAIETIAIIIGSIATAFGLVAIAQGIATTVTTVWTTVSTVATVATTALGAAVAFLTSPLTLITLAIAAVIAIGALLVANWDTIKAKAIELWSNITEKFENIKTAISEKLTAAKETVLSIFDSIKTSISEKIEAAKETVRNAIDAIKGFFKFEWSLPSIKLPHFKKVGETALGLPKIAVSWYAKGGILQEPTIFGSNGGQLMGGGEAGPEAVAPIGVLQGYVADAVSSVVAGQNAVMVSILEQILEAIIALDDNMGGNLREALAGTRFSINDREFARLVKAVG